MFLFDEIDAGLEFDFDLWSEPLVTTETSMLGSASDVEFSREERLDWLEFEFAGYPTDDDPDSFVVDDAGELVDDGDEPIRVSQWQLASDRDTLRHLQRGWRDLFREGRDGQRVVRGAHPFSTEEGSAEWLGRVRSALREEYRKARSDDQRAAIRAREAALRARHNARCWARAFARYWRLDENQTLGMLNAWQKQNPIGWLGLEKAMRSLFEGCFTDFHLARERWDASFDPSWSQAARDEWLDRMPIAPEHPTCLVTSVKTIRREERPVERVTKTIPKRDGDRPVPVLGVSGTPAEVSARRTRESFLTASASHQTRREALAMAPRVSRGNVRRWVRLAQEDAEWFAVRKEWERAEMPDLDYEAGSNTRARLEAAGVTDEVVAAFYRERALRTAA